MVDEYYRQWHVWVTAVCGRDAAHGYIADIKLGSNSFSSSGPPGSNVVGIR